MRLTYPKGPDALKGNIKTSGGCLLNDELEINPRIKMLSPSIRFVAQRLFLHRHSILRKNLIKLVNKFLK